MRTNNGKEVWLPVKGMPYFLISSNGRLKNDKGRLMSPYLTNSGYFMIGLWNRKEHKHEKHYIHRLVADTFFDGIHENMQVNHIDGNKTNNFVGNLEWVTASENAKHAIRTGLHVPYRLPPHPHEGKRVRIIETGEEFNSLTECANHIGGFKTAISACLLGKVKSHLGYHFEEI